MKQCELVAIQNRARKATPGPWRRVGLTIRQGFTFAHNEVVSPDEIVVGWLGFDSASGGKGQKCADAAFIAHARDDVPTLLVEYDSLTAQVEELTLAVARLEGDLIQARQHLVWSWQTYKACPCGARLRMPTTHPHSLGCPTEIALSAEAAVLAAAGGEAKGAT